MSNAPLILGSSSPRRKDLLAVLGIVPDQVCGADIDETPQNGELPQLYVRRVAHQKNQALASQFQESYLLTADTIVAVGRRLLMKPQDANQVREFLQLLSGRSHRVLSAVVLRAPDGRVSTRTVTTKITVKRLSEDEMSYFISTNEWQGKSGGYAIQGVFQAFVRYIGGSVSNVVGLPLYETGQMLTGMGYRWR